ncbi:MAG: hypothetical protein ACRYFS_05380 [Janthinobacterium lividum]
MGLQTLTVFSVLFLLLAAAHAQAFHVDFSRWARPPLVKTKFGVYQTPFLQKADLLRAAALLPVVFPRFTVVFPEFAVVFR